MDRETMAKSTDITWMRMTMADKIDKADGKDMYEADRDNNTKAAGDKTCKPNSTQTMIQSRYATTRNIGKNMLCP